MLNPSEIADVKSQLAINSPNHTAVHGDTEEIKSCHTTIPLEGLVKDGVACQEEDYDGTAGSIDHPTQYTGPAKEDILHTILVQLREL